MTVRITLRYFDGCPNWTTARERLNEAVRAVGLADRVSIDLERVETEEDAERLRFRGSPTVLIEGVDPFASDDAPFGLSCRVYRTEAGLEGSPSVTQLREALTGSRPGVPA